MRPHYVWTGAVMAVLLASVSIDARRAAPTSSLAAQIPTYRQSQRLLKSDTLGAPTPLQAAVLLQAIDCNGNLRMLDLLRRGPLRAQIDLSVLWFVGAATDTVTIRRLLPAWTQTVPLRAVPATVMTDLRRLGHTSTPSLIMLDQDRRVRFVTQSPRSPREFAGLRRIIEGLTWIEEF